MLKLDFGIIYTMINILVLFLFLKIFLFKPVTDIMEKRKKNIEDSLREADNKKIEADQLKQNYEESLMHASEQVTVMIKESKERAEAEYNRILQDAKVEAAKIIVEANAMIEREKKKSMESAQAEIASIAMLAAAKVIGKNVDDSTNKKLLGDFLQEVGAAK